MVECIAAALGLPMVCILSLVLGAPLRTDTGEATATAAQDLAEHGVVEAPRAHDALHHAHVPALELHQEALA